MRIPNGSTDRWVKFVAVDATDLKTREPGLTTFTVYYELDDGTVTAMTTPTVTESSLANMPGHYRLLIDESDMTTLDAAHDTEELSLHITQADMAPVTRVIEVYRPETTEGNTLDVTSTGAGGIDWANVENKNATVDLSATDIRACGTVTTPAAASTPLSNYIGDFAPDSIVPIAFILTDSITAANIQIDKIELDATGIVITTKIGEDGIYVTDYENNGYIVLIDTSDEGGSDPEFWAVGADYKVSLIELTQTNPTIDLITAEFSIENRSGTPQNTLIRTLTIQALEELKRTNQDLRVTKRTVQTISTKV